MNPWRLSLARRALEAGGIVAVPTEGVWGLSCDPLDGEAVMRLLELKGRPEGKGLILVASDPEMIHPWLDDLPAEAWERVTASWPGPVTWLLPAREEVPHWVRGANPRLAVRVTAHPVMAALCEAWGGALVSTSANPAGRPPALDALTVRRYFDGRIDALLPGSLQRPGRPSEIRTLEGAIVRPG